MTGRTNITTEVTASYLQVRLYLQGSDEYYIASMGKLPSCLSDADLLSKRFDVTYENYVS